MHVSLSHTTSVYMAGFLLDIGFKSSFQTTGILSLSDLFLLQQSLLHTRERRQIHILYASRSSTLPSFITCQLNRSASDTLLSVKSAKKKSWDNVSPSRHPQGDQVRTAVKCTRASVNSLQRPSHAHRECGNRRESSSWAASQMVR